MKSLDPVQILMDDHKRIRGLLRQVQVLDQRAHEMMDGLVEQLFLELGVHRVLMQKIVIPAIFDLLAEDRKGVFEEIDDRRREIVRTIRELRGTKIGVPGAEAAPHTLFDQRMAELRKLVEQHCEEEEREVFPVVRQLLGTRATDIANRLHSERERIINNPRYSHAHPSRVQNPHGGEHKRKIPA